MNNRRLTIVKNEKKQVLIFPLRRYFLEGRKKGTERKMFTFFFTQQKKQGHLKQSSKANQVDKRKGGKRFTLT